jgi:site-specific DNA-methyltransferase (adenine-specific)
MGSGSTGVACLNTKRNFIGIEKELKYFEIAKNRIKSVTAVQMELKGV